MALKNLYFHIEVVQYYNFNQKIKNLIFIVLFMSL